MFKKKKRQLQVENNEISTKEIGRTNLSKNRRLNVNNSGYLQFAKQIATEAGEIMLKYFNQENIGQYKTDDTIVTKADTEINNLLIDKAEEAYPGHGIYGEENSYEKTRNVLWVCDPLDGTASYSRGIPVAVFSLALVVDGKTQLGVVYDPFTKSMYEAVPDGGAYCNGKKLQVNNYQLGTKEAAIGYDYSPTMSFNTAHIYYELSQKSRIGGTGSFVHNAMLVATGGYVASIASGDRPYDIAAAKIIVEEAGGRVTDLFGQDQRYDREIKGAIISNGIVHDGLVGLIKRFENQL